MNIDPAKLPPIERLIKALKRLPGIGDKGAARHTYFLLSAPAEVSLELGEALLQLRREIVLCEICFNLTQQSPCTICTDPARSESEVCVVEEPADVASIEAAGSFRGRYHVLGGTLSPLEGAGPESLRIAPLLERAAGGDLQEIILATNPTPEGEATALYLARQLEGHGLRITRIGYGLPMGGDLEYTDAMTVRKSLEARRHFGS